MIIRGQREDMEGKAAEVIAGAIDAVLQQKDFVVLGVVGGRSVGKIFEHLVNEKIEWHRVHLFMVDERLVPLDSEDSNFGLARQFLKDIFAPTNMHPFVYDPESKDEGIGEYQELFSSYGGKFDVILLSSGEDGHVAALFPEHESIASDERGFIKMDNSPKPPSKRMTASRKLLQQSTVGVLLFFGESKEEAFGNVQDDALTVIQCPAKLVQSLSEFYIFTDI